MKIRLINSTEHPWIDKVGSNYRIIFKGYFWDKDDYYSGYDAIECLKNLFNEKKMNEVKDIICNRLSGHFAIIIDSDSFALAIVDKIRSIPIFYSKKGEKTILSNSAVSICNKLDNFEINDKSLTIFNMSGYCLKHSTLHKDIKQLLAGQFIFINKKNNKLRINYYYRYIKFENRIMEKRQFAESLHQTFMKTFKKLVESLKGNQVMIPLSGGYDSRLIVAMLKEFSFKNIKAYTYGVKNLWEVERAKYISNLLGIECINIEFNPSKTRALFKSKVRQDYFKFAGGLNSAPHLPDFYAIIKLRKQRFIDKNAIFINGQSGDFITGGHIPSILNGDKSDSYNWNSLFDVIMNDHFSLWTNLKTGENRKILLNELHKFFDFYKDITLDKEKYSKLYELFEFEERQSKFVVNGQRIYEFFGYDWRLPLWSDELIRFWSRVPFNLKFGQKLYLDYLKKQNFGGVFDNISLPKQYSYFPRWSLFPRSTFKILSMISGNEIGYYYNKYFKYFMTYGPFYPQQSYFKYLKDSTYHRNPISYGLREYIKEIGYEKNIY